MGQDNTRFHEAIRHAKAMIAPVVPVDEIDKDDCKGCGAGIGDLERCEWCGRPTPRGEFCKRSNGPRNGFMTVPPNFRVHQTPFGPALIPEYGILPLQHAGAT